jgi:hypothetical protein
LRLRYSCSLAVGALCAVPAFAGNLAVNIELPRLTVSEYHRPYVAVWVERAEQAAPVTLAVWYDQKTRGGDGEGTKWLKDLRQWWRRTGRELQMPVDGVSGATRPAGRQTLTFTEGTAPLAKLPPGAYQLMVEAAREHGGRETVAIPFQWPPTAGQQLQAKGSAEIGAVSLDLKP